LVSESISDEDLQAIRQQALQQCALGSPRFQAAIEALAGRCVTVRPLGRPRRERGTRSSENTLGHDSRSGPHLFEAVPEDRGPPCAFAAPA
jgi:hypothetical protein